MALAAGIYHAVRKRIGIPMLGGSITWTSQSTLSAEQLAGMGAILATGLLSVEYDGTNFVRDGVLGLRLRDGIESTADAIAVAEDPEFAS